MNMEFYPTENQYKGVYYALRRVKQKLKLLEIGAGDRTLKKFLPENITYHSMDYQDKHYYFDNKIKHEYNFDLDKGKMPIKDNTYDIVVCLETLEHTMYPERVLQEIKRIAKPNALIFLSMPNDYNIVQRIYFLFGIKGKMDESFQVVEKHLHIHKVRAKDIVSLFSKNFRVLEVNYLWQSRSSMYSNLVATIDRIIAKISPIFPSLFARMVFVRAINVKN